MNNDKLFRDDSKFYNEKLDGAPEELEQEPLPPEEEEEEDDEDDEWEEEYDPEDCAEGACSIGGMGYGIDYSEQLREARKLK